VSDRTFVIHDKRSDNYVSTVFIAGGYMWSRDISNASRFRQRAVATRHANRATSLKGCGPQWRDVDCHVVPYEEQNDGHEAEQANIRKAD
jgi:hypothetical protein